MELATTNLSLYGPTNSLPTGEAKKEELNKILGHMYFFLTGITSILSIFGSVVIIVSFIVFKDMRTLGRKLLVYLSIADFLTASGNLLGIVWYLTRDQLNEGGVKWFCEFHAALTIFSSNCSFLWTVSIAIHLYVCVVWKDARKADRLVPGFHVVCWPLPSFLAIIAWALGVIGYDKTIELPSWCWIDPETDYPGVLFWQYFTGKFWEILSYILVVIFYTMIKFTLRKQIKATKGGGSNVILEANRKLTFVPAVYIVTRIWGTLRHIFGAHLHQHVNEYAIAWIVPLQGVGDSAQGFANCVLFCLMTRTLRKRIRKCFCPGSNKTKPDEQSTHVMQNNIHS